MNKNRVLKIIKDNKKELSKFGVIKIGIFGSFAKGTFTTNSDIDILVEIEKSKKTLHNFLEIKRFLEKKLQKKIDLTTPEALKKYIKKEILETVLYV
ncbi:nucleotidyltransferase family protein [Nitrosophilus labii]|uniref:nucleotidyltransferase family protein n=1 Tax=Nitrosophilus labii TaxID=2706014 RepID=UPI00165713A9|nr:nucleotidyltransferase family protein [Nitrosophilus labii]